MLVKAPLGNTLSLMIYVGTTVGCRENVRYPGTGFQGFRSYSCVLLQHQIKSIVNKLFVNKVLTYKYHVLSFYLLKVHLHLLNLTNVVITEHNNLY